MRGALNDMLKTPDTRPALSERERVEAAIAAEESRRAQQAATTADERERLPKLREQLAGIDRAEQQAEARARVSH